MCGIIGAISKRDIVKTLIDGLHRLEYRGYDSSGLAVINSKKKLVRLRCVGKIQVLKKLAEKHPLSANIGIAHTRWATHGKPSKNNAHPHISKHIIIVHNGIIENYQSLREALENRGYVFLSETDTEVIAHLVHWEQMTKRSSLRDAILRVIPQLYGTYGMVMMDSRNPNTLLATRFGSSMVIGVGTEGNFIASDQLALLPVTSRFIFLEEGDIAEITRYSISIFNRLNKKIERQCIQSNIKDDPISKGEYNHYMQKEIYEQPKAIKNTLAKRINDNKINLNELGVNANEILSKIEHIQIVACGTSYNSAMTSRYWFESLANIPCDVEIASEFRYRKSIIHRNSLIITLSQSGETADTLAALRLSKQLGYLASLTISNTPSSSLVRESDLVLMTKAGSEIGVASTKTFTTQLTILLILVAKLAHLKDKNSNIQNKIIHGLQILPNRIEQILSRDKYIKKIAKDFSNKQHVLFLGRGDQYPIALEGALKMKELSYIYAEGYAAGELKHGPLALVDSNMLVIVLAPKNELFSKLKSNIEEVCSRGGQVYAFTNYDGFNKSNSFHVVKMPYVERIIEPIFYAIPLQLLAYHVAIIKGIDVDRPRNLAKSVTVE